MRRLRVLVLAASLCGACLPWHRSNPTPVRSPRDTARVTQRDTVEQRAARLELKVLEQEAQVADLQSRLDDARLEVVRAMAKLQSLATRAEAASGIAEAEIALQALRAANGNTAPASPEYGQGSHLLQLATTEFDRQNYGGALYLATEAKNVAAAGQGRVSSDDRTSRRTGEVPFALPLRLQTSGRANVREGPGSGFNVLFTLEAGVPIVGYSYVEQWVRIKDDSGRTGWIYQTLIGRRQ
jgi:hypothetical protein